MELNITNGDYFNQYFINKYHKNAISFGEAMIDGNAVLDIFSSEFIKIRANSHNVSVQEYKNKFIDFINLRNKINEISDINLYFGLDSFCVINLLTILAYLEEINYHGKVFLNVIDEDNYEITKKNIVVTLGIYKDIYNEILIKKNNVKDCGVLNRRGLDLYFDYLSPAGNLARIIKDNDNYDSDDLLLIILKESKEYGISDVMARNLINKYRH